MIELEPFQIGMKVDKTNATIEDSTIFINYEVNRKVNIMKINDITKYLYLLTSKMIIKICDYCGLKEFVVYENKNSISKDSSMGIYFFVHKNLIIYIGSVIKESLYLRILKHKKYYGEKILFINTLNKNKTFTKRFEHGLICLIQPEKNSLYQYDKIR